MLLELAMNCEEEDTQDGTGHTVLAIYDHAAAVDVLGDFEGLELLLQGSRITSGVTMVVSDPRLLSGDRLGGTHGC